MHPAFRVNGAMARAMFGFVTPTQHSCNSTASVPR